MKVDTPRSLEQALDLISDGARAVAGMTAYQLDWSQGGAAPERMVAVGHLLPAGIDGLTIGAATPLEDIRHAGLPLLSEAARDVAAPNVRRLATLGGQIGWGKGCLLPALLALDATVETTQGPVPVASYLKAPQGLVLSVTLKPSGRPVWRKMGLRAGFTAAIIAVAGMVDRAEGAALRATLAVGGGAVMPARLPETEAWLVEQIPADLDCALLMKRLEDEIEAPGCAFRTASYRRRSAARALVHGIVGLAPLPRPPLLRPVAQPAPTLAEISHAADPERWHTRPDMVAKVRGKQQYLTDRRAPDMLVGRILRAAHPHAEILAIDTQAAEALPGVMAVVTHRDVPGQNAFGILIQDQPALCHDKVRYSGDAVAAVAAVDGATAERALSLISVEYAPLPVVKSADAALAAGAAHVHAAGNLLTETGIERGDPAAAMETAAHVVDDIYVTPRQMHGFMETEGGWAAPENGGLLMCAGGQYGMRDRAQLARILGLPEDKIRVVTSPVGGGFGGKDELTVQPALALLALKAQAPVRLHLSRAESLEAGTKRNPMKIHLRMGCDDEGRLVALEADLLSESGGYASLSPGVLETALEHAAGPYDVANVQTRGRLAYTNNGTCGAFRGFGANQMTFAVECQMDRLARLVGIDPVEIRRRNLRRPGTPGFLGQRVAPSERLDEMLAAASSSPLWQPFDVKADEVAGVGMALNYQGNGLGSIPTDEARFVLRLRNGQIEALCGLDEMGQGLAASMQAAVADQMGCARSDVVAVFGDTAAAPDSGSTSASRGGHVVWRGAAATAPQLAERICSNAARILGCKAKDLQIVPGGVAARASNTKQPLVGFDKLGSAEAETFFRFPKTEYDSGNARFIFAFGATLARVAISRVTGAVRVVDLEMHTAAGPVMDLASYLGQMEGGLIQGLGFTLTEDVPYADGRPVVRNFDTYAVPTVRDAAARIRVTAHEALDADDPYGPRGVGELGIGAVTPAIANAVADALGAWPTVTPIPPETVLDMLETK